VGSGIGLKKKELSNVGGTAAKRARGALQHTIILNRGKIDKGEATSVSWGEEFSGEELGLQVGNYKEE